MCLVFIAHRPPQVTQALTLPTTRSLCQARGTVLYTTTATDIYTGSRFRRRKKKVTVSPEFVCGCTINYVRHSSCGTTDTLSFCLLQAHDQLKGWPTGLRDGLGRLEETKTAHLPRVVCLGIGLPVVLSKPSGQHVALGVCNNSDGEWFRT